MLLDVFSGALARQSTSETIGRVATGFFHPGRNNPGWVRLMSAVQQTARVLGLRQEAVSAAISQLISAKLVP